MSSRFRPARWPGPSIAPSRDVRAAASRPLHLWQRVCRERRLRKSPQRAQPSGRKSRPDPSPPVRTRSNAPGLVTEFFWRPHSDRQITAQRMDVRRGRISSARHAEERERTCPLHGEELRVRSFTHHRRRVAVKDLCACEPVSLRRIKARPVFLIPPQWFRAAVCK